VSYPATSTDSDGPVADFVKARGESRKLLFELDIHEPPVPVQDIAERLGLKVEVWTFSTSEDISGFIDLSATKIVVNAEDVPQRQAFTIAHELGHWVLHREDLEKNPDMSIMYRQASLSAERDAKEQEANAFAAELLVPLAWLKKYMEYPAKVIAEVFGVSRDVIGYRLSWID
jgi:Zn-dependent peptidase ImmA (M78 family)